MLKEMDKQMTQNIKLKIKNNEVIENGFDKANLEDSRNFKWLIDIMKPLFEKCSKEAEHSTNVSEICGKIARELNFDKKRIVMSEIAGFVHDIGKVKTDKKILNSEDKLGYEEWKEMVKHPVSGSLILRSKAGISYLSQAILEHHERWDGKGYPEGIKGNGISMFARIIAVADAYDVMTSTNSYKKNLNEEEAVNEIIRCSGTQFDPEVARVFVQKVLKKDRHF